MPSLQIEESWEDLRTLRECLRGIESEFEAAGGKPGIEHVLHARALYAGEEARVHFCKARNALAEAAKAAEALLAATEADDPFLEEIKRMRRAYSGGAKPVEAASD